MAGQDEAWMVQWWLAQIIVFQSQILICTFRRNPQTKKHKTWDGDGVLVSRTNGESTLYDINGAM